MALDDPDRYRSEPVWDVLPFGGRLLDRRESSTLDAIDESKPA